MTRAIPLQLLDAPEDGVASTGAGPDGAPLDRRGRPLHDLRISVIDQCNFRCPYCMPEDQYPRDHAFLRAAERLSFEEIERLARAFVSLGVRKLRLTGGEPLLRRDLPRLVAALAAIPGVTDLAMTSNGVLLPRHAQALRDAGLQRLTLSLDTLDPEVFRKLSGGRGEAAQVLEGIAAAEAAGFARIKLNSVIVRDVNDAGALDLVAHFRGSGHVVRFIEYMDVGTCNGWQSGRVVPAQELRQRIHARWPLLGLDANYPGEVASRYAFADGQGEIGFITSVSEPFCGDCSRARIAADGKLYTCLFAREGFDLRAAVRSGASVEALAGVIDARWRRRADRYSEQRAELRAAGALQHVEMYTIGG